jgi:uncharacterized BrkB/YihY/UPF0761 family membrane protein
MTEEGHPPAGWFSRRWAAVTRRVDAADAFQQRHAPLAFPAAVVRKYSDDRGGRLASQIAYAGFQSVFPLFLVFVTSVGIVLAGHKQLQTDLVDSALRQFPVIGSDIYKNVQQLSTGNALGLVVGVVWLLYGATRLSRSSQAMLARVWGIDRDDLPDLPRWLPRAVGFLATLGVGFIAGGALAGIGSFGGFGSYSTWIGLAGSLVVNVCMYRVAFTVLIALPGTRRGHWVGALVGGVAWTVLLNAGALLVNHQVRHLSNLYGTFAVVLGLTWWLALGAMVSVYAAEVDAVVSLRLWPRPLRRAREQGADPR